MPEMKLIGGPKNGDIVFIAENAKRLNVAVPITDRKPIVSKVRRIKWLPFWTRETVSYLEPFITGFRQGYYETLSSDVMVWQGYYGSLSGVDKDGE